MNLILRLAVLPLVAIAMIGCTTPGGDGVIWPRFPLDPATRSERVLALVYSTGMLGPNSTLAHLGYPGRNIFRLHAEHPRLGLILRSCPASRYSGGKSVLESPAASDTWRALATDPRFDWIEIANQGYTHSPPDDSNLHHHEFSTTQKGCNLEHDRFGEDSYVEDRMEKIRSTYRELGIAWSVIRFPGNEHSPGALRAAIKSGVAAVLGRGEPGEPYRERWVPAAGEEMMILPAVKLRTLTSGSDLLEKDSPAYRDLVDRGMRRVDDAVEGGGILLLSDDWSQTFQRIGGAYPRYAVLDSILRHAEERFSGSIWYPRGRDLALWLHARRGARATARTDENLIEARIELPETWDVIAGPGLEEASVILTLPRDWKRVKSIRIDDGSGWRDLASSRFWMTRDGIAIVFHLKGSVSLQALREE